MIQAFEQLEKEFGEFIGNPNTVAVASGTAALHVACEVARTLITDDVTGIVQPRIAIPEYTMVACPRAARMADMQPVFVDCLDNLQMNMDLVPDNVDAVMAVHIYGNLCDMEKIAYRPGRLVIEDMAEVHGARPHPNTFAACWSFYKNKTIHGEEGGMIAFKSPREAGLAKRLRTLGFDQHHDYFHEPRGVNARMSNAHAELILPSLRNYEQNVQRRLFIRDMYAQCLPTRWQFSAPTFPWVFPLQIRGMKRHQQAELVRIVNESDIAARHGFKSMLWQEEFVFSAPLSLPASNVAKLQYEIVYLPIPEDMTGTDAALTCQEFMHIAKIVIPELTP